MSLSKHLLLYMSIASCAIADAYLGGPGIDSSFTEGESHIQRRDPVADCIKGLCSSSCWNTLNLTQWLSDWNATTELCTTSETNSCRAANELWTDAFLRIAKDEPRGSSCVNLHACPVGAVPDLKDIRHDVNEVDRVRYQYILYNIYGEVVITFVLTVRRLNKAAAINSFFSDWYQWMYNAAFEAEGEIVNIVKETGPPNKKCGVLLHDILSALTAGLAFLAIPEAAALGKLPSWPRVVLH